jgi:hypothetical protein
VKNISIFPQQLLKVFSYITAGDVYPSDTVGHGEPLEDGYCVRHAVTSIEYDTRCPAASVEREDGLDGDVESRHVVSLEKVLRSHVAIRTRIEGRFCEEDGMLFITRPG